MDKKLFWGFLFWVSVGAAAQSMPRQNIAHHADKLPPLTSAGVKALAQGLLNSMNTDPNLTYVLRAKLDKMAKAPSLNVAGTGAFYLSLGVPLDASGYLIAKGVVGHVFDPYGVNALGVYYRDSGSLIHALECFFYADGLLGAKQKSPYIYTNIAWAAFYYGDWTTAQTYFTKALAISSNFQAAMEGNATLAYAKGDLQALFKCLSQELMASFSTTARSFGGGAGGSGSDGGGSGGSGSSGSNGGGSGSSGSSGGDGGDGGPSTAFTAMAGGIMPDYSSDPTSNTTYDNLGSGDDDSGDQDPPPGGPVTFPQQFKPIFVNTIKDVAGAMAQKTQVMAQANAVINSLKNQASGSNLQPNGITYTDEQGNIIHNHDYSKFLNLHAGIIQLLEQRIDWHIKKEFRKPLQQNYDKAAQQFSDMNTVMTQKLVACNGNEKCAMGVYCQYVPQFQQVGNDVLDAGCTIWKQLYDKVYDDLNWFLQNDGAFVTRIHVPEANTVLNIDRELECRVAILKLYEIFFDDVLGAALSFSMTYNSLSAQPLDCSVEARTIGGADPFAKVPKHIKEYVDPNCSDKSFYMVVGNIIENCHTTTFQLGGSIGPLQLGINWTTPIDPATGKIKDQIYVQNNDNFGGSVGASVGITQHLNEFVTVGAGVNGSVTYNQSGKVTGYTAGTEVSAGADIGVASLGGKATSTWQLDANGNVTGYTTGTSVSGAAGATSGNGVAATGALGTTSMYDKNGNYIGGSNTANGSVTTTTGVGPGSMTASYFGVQANQVIQVVAGQAQVQQ